MLTGVMEYWSDGFARLQYFSTPLSHTSPRLAATYEHTIPDRLLPAMRDGISWPFSAAKSIYMIEFEQTEI